MSQPTYAQAPPSAFGRPPPYHSPQQTRCPASCACSGYPPQPQPQPQPQAQYHQVYPPPHQSQPSIDGVYPRQQQQAQGPRSAWPRASHQHPQRGQADDGATVDPGAQALAEYGSPFARSKDWRATRADLELSGFPEQNFTLRVKQRFARSPGDVWSQRAPSFSRPAQPGWSYAPFQPFSLPASGEQLADGFKPLYPGRILADHDVSAADWCRFLEDISVAGRMTGAQQLISNFAPVTAHLGATGFLVTKAIQKRMKRNKQPVITETVEMWVQNFFLCRGLDVYIKDNQGRITALAPGDQVPAAFHSASKLDANHSDGSDDESSDEGMPHEKTRKERKKERDERKKNEKAERKRKKQERRKNKKKPHFYLVVAPYQPRQ